NGPVRDLNGTYINVPGTGEKPADSADVDKLQARCEALVKEVGGATVPRQHWEKIVPSPTPNPTPSPSSSPNATASPSPSASGTPFAFPSPTFAFPISSPAATAPANSTHASMSSPAATRSPIKKRKP